MSDGVKDGVGDAVSVTVPVGGLLVGVERERRKGSGPNRAFAGLRTFAVTSVVGATGNPGQGNYAASKAGVVGFVRQLAAETGRKGITVNALSLGTMNNWEGSEELARKNCIIPRAGSPADVGAGVAWLASREAEWVTGQIVPLNGGGITA